MNAIFQKTCPVCGDGVEPVGRRVYCSPACKQVSYRNKKEGVVTIAPKRPILRYHGGKWRLAHWIMPFLTAIEHQVYVEPFCGAASVLAQKPRIGHEVLNDLNGRVVNLFRVLRDPAKAQRLAKLVYLTPYSNQEYWECRVPADDPVEDARRMMTVAAQAFSTSAVAGGKGQTKTTWRRRISERNASPATSWAAMPDVVMAWAERLRGVSLEHDTAINVIKRWDNPDVLFFVDPPYLHSTRNRGGRGYAHEMSDAEHIEMAEVLHQVQGAVVLCGYPSELYDRLFKDWRRVERRGYTGGVRTPTEVLWINRGEGRLEETPKNLTG